MLERKERVERRDARERRQLILQKASELFAEHGVENVSMRQIAREAGVGQGTLYRSYAHKGELCLDLIEEQCIRNHEKMAGYLKENNNESLRVRLEVILEYHLISLQENSHVLAAIQAPTSEERQNVTFHTLHYELVHSVIHGLFQEYIETGGEKQLDPVYMADSIMATLRPDVYLFHRQHRNYSAEEIRSKLFQIYIDPIFGGHSDPQ
ncbi:TetR/AcrR family transcriptional regulator [Paenibacillus sepulcri]|uniref:TetR/AcrR family transcriptional regulator n=1 Tax=Paenibacillus sepulcri TaxID=359917 RepID=A0ABS7BXX7_9BACL|nr:TetR/AcrR family transcriptional regulator [Paenibacillus sepulcri]